MAGPPTTPEFALTDHFGRAVRESDFHGRFRLVYFGFTACRVICPRALTKLSAMLDAIGEDIAGRIQPLYITVDPARDTPAVMHAYLKDRHPRFLGLTGSEDAIAQAKAAFRVFAQRKHDADDPGGYQIAHTAIAYLLDRDGRYLDHFPDTLDADEIGHRLHARLNAHA